MALKHTFPVMYNAIKKKVTKEHVTHILLPLNKVKAKMVEYFKNRKDYQVMITLKDSGENSLRYLRRLQLETFIYDEILKGQAVANFKKFNDHIKGIGYEIERMSFEVNRILRGIIERWKQVDGAAGVILT